MNTYVQSNSVSVTLQNIIQEYGPTFRNSHPVPYPSHRVLNAIERCHTPALGAHIIRCHTPECGYEKFAYNSCRNRHCPGCQGSQSARWVGQREAELLPVSYFHVCFTLPHELNALVLANKELLYDCLFAAAWEAMSELLGSSKKERDFRQRDVRRNKQGTKAKDFLVPVGPLRILFKNKFLGKLGKAYKEKLFVFLGQTEPLSNPDTFYQMKEALYAKNSVVYCKEPFAGPKQVLAYLGRYTHWVAISNSRLINMENGKVTFSLKNYRKEGRKEVMVLPAADFIRRFLLHVLPKGFRRIRMYGFLSNRYKQKNLELIRELLNQGEEAAKVGDTKEDASVDGMGMVAAKKPKPTVAEVILKSTGVNILLCPKCGQCGLKLIRGYMPGSE